MNTLRKNTVGTLATLMLLFTLSSNAQTQGQLIDESETSLTIRLESEEPIEKPTKILLVYDSNLITLESTSVYAQNYKTRVRSTTNNYRLSTSALEDALAVEMEEDIEMEDWMLSPFKLEASIPSYLKEEDEEEIELEPWMTDLSSWNM